MEKYNRISEIFWLIMAIVTGAMALYLVSVEGYQQNKWYVILPLLPLSVYFMRRLLRKRFEKTRREMEEKAKKGK